VKIASSRFDRDKELSGLVMLCHGLKESFKASVTRLDKAF